MVIETYRQCRPEREEISHTVHQHDRREICKALEFEHQATDPEGPLTLARAVYPEISEQDWHVWMWWLPTTFEKPLRGPSLLPGSFDRWEDYAYDWIPEEVLQEIQMAKELHCFDTLSLHTPYTPTALDPICVGTIVRRGAPHRFLISRWGESLLPFEAIHQKQQHTARLRWAYPVVVLCLFVGVFVTLFISR